MRARTSARQRVLLKTLDADAVRTMARRIFPKKNDYVGDLSLFEELLPELERFGIRRRGQLKRLLTTHRRALMADDRSPLAAWEVRYFSEMYGAEFVRDAVRRHYWFAYPALIRNALESEFGEAAAVREAAA